MIHQWKNSVETDKFIDEMSYAARIVKSLIVDDQIEVQHLIRLSDSDCRDFLNQTMHFRKSTRLAIDRFRCLFWFWIIFRSSIFFIWLMISNRQWSNLRCQIHDVALISVLFLSWIECACIISFFFIRTYFMIRRLWCVFISHIISSNFLCLRVLIYMSRSYPSFIRRVADIKVMLMKEIQTVLTNFMIMILFFNFSFISIVSYSWTFIRSFEMMIQSSADFISSIKRDLLYVRRSLHLESYMTLR